MALCSAIHSSGGSGGELERIKRKEKLPDLIMWRAGQLSPMTSCIALIPNRNECFLGARHRFEAKEKLWLNETWLPLRNSQPSEGERYVTRCNEVRWVEQRIHWGNKEQRATPHPTPGTSCFLHPLTQQQLAEKGKLDHRKWAHHGSDINSINSQFKRTTAIIKCRENVS